ncbi:MAG: hypothetical protein OEZ06_24590 [Myxococcales bacterium]|nr:hypothetical protein [Myxococcales bacterium]
MSRLFAALLCLWAIFCGRALAEPLVVSSDSTRTLPEGRIETGVFQPVRYGLHDGLELSSHILMLVNPQLQAKWRFFERGRYSSAAVGRLSYPKPLLDLLAGEGALGLLPEDSRVPQVLVLDMDALATAEWMPEQLLTLSAGISVAPRGSAEGMPLLDFPFLYARFAVLKTTAVYRAGLGYEAMLGARFRLAADVKLFFLPVVDGGFSLEPGLSLRWLLAEHVALEAGARFEYARYPPGMQFHYLPFIDALFAW